MNHKDIEILEEFAADLYKEILLNEVAILEANEQLKNLKNENLFSEKLSLKSKEIKQFIERLKQINVRNRKQIVAIEYQIQKLKNNE